MATVNETDARAGDDNDTRKGDDTGAHTARHRWLLRLGVPSYLAFLGWAVYSAPRADLLRFDGGVGLAKGVLCAVYLAFLAWSVHCSVREDLVHIVGRIARMRFGTQIIVDLYLSVGLSLGLIYLHTGSVWVLLAWLVPVLVFVNLAVALFVILHLYELVARFT